jgi:allantoinase
LFLIKDGLIVDILATLRDGGTKVIDIKDSVLMPGVTDPHLHINEPGRNSLGRF